MNILIVSHFYEIDGVMGSVRWTSFAHRLAKKHNVFVVTHEENMSNRFAVENRSGITVLKIDNECDYVKRRKNKSIQSRIAKPIVLKKTEVNKESTSLKNILRTILYIDSMKRSAERNSKEIVRYLNDNGIKIDCIITTSRPFIDAFIGYYMVKSIGASWILDQRDLQYNDGTSKFTINYYCRIFRMMDKYVKTYTLVSFGMAESFKRDCCFSDSSSKKVKELHNGYNKDDYIADSITDLPLAIAYSGDMYLGRRDADMLFAAMKMVIEKNDDITVKDFCVSYAGKEGDVIRLQAEKYRIGSVVEDHGFVSHSQAIELQHNADIELLLTWNTEMDRGILPGKFYEYMMVEKPIICITSGSVPNGEAEIMINDMQLGIAVNQINYEDGINQLAAYLECQLRKKREAGTVLYTADKEKVSMFDYDNLIVKLEQLIEDIT